MRIVFCRSAVIPVAAETERASSGKGRPDGSRTKLGAADWSRLDSSHVLVPTAYAAG